ncbi:hypothetical protein, partial [Alistipes ihumii]|uniref:hypothetical protein n=1 Tax=Alistipes ihumii TaxID=1470347 RepID=UPI003AAF3399
PYDSHSVPVVHILLSVKLYSFSNITSFPGTKTARRQAAKIQIIQAICPRGAFIHADPHTLALT